jgi:hypothetical protein
MPLELESKEAHVWPPPRSDPSANHGAASRTPETEHERVRAAPVRFLVDAPAAAAVLSISERKFHSLRKRADFPQDATVILGPRCVRFRLDALQTFAISLVAIAQTEPRQLRESRRNRERPSRGEAKPALERRYAKYAPIGDRQRKK